MADYLIADTHLDHRNIIRYSSRPFKSVGGMNSIILRNLRDTVTPHDTLYILGDLALGKPTWWWAKRLPGQVVLIRGNHDGYAPSMACCVLSTELGDILLVHNPVDATGWPGWAIHGHVHKKRPFIDFTNRRVNVSAEVIGYKPVAIETVLANIGNGAKAGKRLKTVTGIPFTGRRINAWAV